MDEGDGGDGEGGAHREGEGVSGFADLWPRVRRHDPLGGEEAPTPRTAGALANDLDAVYRERTFVVAALAHTMWHYMADLGHAPGEAVWLARHVGPWEEEWRWIVCIDLDQIGVVTWHIHDSELPLFRFLNQRTAPGYEYDGHSTDEKYRRIYEYVTGQKR